ncbi:hypothetical protein KC901_00585 [Patescibacteria group bacterium]|nr:hypothetical protein [Patescibacteria group bacterium]
MKKIDTWITIIAALVLIAVGIYLLHKNNDAKDTTYVEVIDGEEVVLDHPLTESFSNAESNKESKKQQKKGSQVYSGVTHVAQKIAEPFILGFYYLKNFAHHDDVPCDLSAQPDEVEFPDYDEDNFELTDVTFGDNSAYLFVDADESPDGICARIQQFSNIPTNPLKAIHVIVDEN